MSRMTSSSSPSRVVRNPKGDCTCDNLVCDLDEKCVKTLGGNCYCVKKKIKGKGEALDAQLEIQPAVQGPAGWTVKNGRYVPPNAPPESGVGTTWIWTVDQRNNWHWVEVNITQILNANPGLVEEWNKACAQAPNGRNVFAFVSVFGSMKVRVYCIYPSDSVPIPLETAELIAYVKKRFPGAPYKLISSGGTAAGEICSVIADDSGTLEPDQAWLCCKKAGEYVCSPVTIKPPPPPEGMPTRAPPSVQSNPQATLAATNTIYRQVAAASGMPLLPDPSNPAHSDAAKVWLGIRDRVIEGSKAGNSDPDGLLNLCCAVTVQDGGICPTGWADCTVTQTHLSKQRYQQIRDKIRDILTVQRNPGCTPPRWLGDDGLCHYGPKDLKDPWPVPQTPLRTPARLQAARAKLTGFVASMFAGQHIKLGAPQAGDTDDCVIAAKWNKSTGQWENYLCCVNLETLTAECVPAEILDPKKPGDELGSPNQFTPQQRSPERAALQGLVR